ncbi:MAG: response regulator [Candidatus Zixiibacteriota bacterium]|nr:MAG: response regulator [candidate division Zixibacteria bacterium]
MEGDMRVLVVDDERYIRETLARLFTDHDFDVAVAEDGEQALQMLAQESFDVVVSDVKMPRMDGFRLLQEIKRIHPQVAVVIMTGFNQDFSIREALTLGAEDYIRKPFKGLEVVMAVQRAQERCHTRRSKPPLASGF